MVGETILCGFVLSHVLAPVQSGFDQPHWLRPHSGDIRALTKCGADRPMLLQIDGDRQRLPSLATAAIEDRHRSTHLQMADRLIDPPVHDLTEQLQRAVTHCQRAVLNFLRAARPTPRVA
jgi:hypothetical protein